MAIKRVAILVDIDTSEKHESSGAVRVDNLPFAEASQLAVPGADETYRVFINDSQNPGPEGKPNKLAMLDAAAHEMGHVLSSIFRMKGGMHEDPRQRAEFFHKPDGMRTRDMATDEQAKRIWNNEKLAWEIAEKIRPELNQEDKKANFASYDWAKERAA